MLPLPVKYFNGYLYVTSAVVEVARLLRKPHKLRIHPSLRFPPANTIIVNTVPAFLLYSDTILTILNVKETTVSLSSTAQHLPPQLCVHFLN